MRSPHLLPERTRVAGAALPRKRAARTRSAVGAGGRRGGTGVGRGAERSGASAAMPREIITLQLGQCGNQSEHATTAAGPGQGAPGGAGMLWWGGGAQLAGPGGTGRDLAGRGGASREWGGVSREWGGACGTGRSGPCPGTDPGARPV